MGVSVVELAEGAELRQQPWYSRDITLFAGRLPPAEQAQLAEELAIALRVSLPVLEAVQIVAESDHAPRTRARLHRVAQQLAEGFDLATAFEQSGPDVPPVFIAILRAGQSSDALPEQLTELALMLRRQDRARSQVVTALIYPAILIVAAVAVVLVVSTTLAPALMPLFEAENALPPPSVALFVAIGETVVSGWPWILGLGTALVCAIVLFFKAVGATLVAHLPVFGALTRDAALLTQLRSLALILKGGLPLADALHAVAEFDRSAPFSGTLSSAAAALERGGRAYDALAADRHLPVTVRELFRVGEEANSLVPVLETLAAAQADRLERRTQRLLRTLTPILTLAIGALVGLLVYSMMDAVFSVNSLAI